MAKLLLVYHLLFAFAITTCSATTYAVGDNSGWDISTDLDTWIQNKKFNVGDSLFFQYSSSHSVNEVTKENFDTCNTTNVLTSYGNGNTTLPLTRGGDRYFVCGNQLHCLGGMKLHVHVQNDNKALSPDSAPKAVAGSDQRTAALPQSPSSKKNTSFSNGVATRSAGDSLQLVYIVLMATVSGMLQILRN